MIFSCSPPERKCEWVHLKSFVDQYNTTFQKSYRRSKCLDKTGEHGKQPEFLINSPGEIPIVIEHKFVVWPPMHLSDHNNEHDRLYTFMNRIRSQGNPFTDSAYQLIVTAESLRGKRKREVARLAEEIADFVLSEQNTAKSPEGIGRQYTIPWHFRPLSPQEMEDYGPDSGIRLNVRVGPGYSQPFESLQEVEIVRSGYADAFDRVAKAAAEKFVKYSDCERLFLVQFFGDDSSCLPDDEIVEIIETAQLPEMIEQVWLAVQEWISESDYEIVWKRIR